MEQLANPDRLGMLSDLWRPILVSWYRKMRPFVDQLGLKTDPFALQNWVLAVRIRTFKDGKDGYTCAYGPDGDQRLFIEYRQDLVSLERERTVAHEFGHVLCIAGGLGPNHHDAWKAIMKMIGYPGEAEKDWSDRV